MLLSYAKYRILIFLLDTFFQITIENLKNDLGSFFFKIHSLSDDRININLLGTIQFIYNWGHIHFFSLCKLQIIYSININLLGTIQFIYNWSDIVQAKNNNIVFKKIIKFSVYLKMLLSTLYFNEA